MPHQCVRCNTFYEDGARELLKGCSCDGKLFFYIKKEKLDEMSEEVMRPKPLINGHDLINLGLSPGPLFSEIMSAIEDFQLEGKLSSKEETLDWVRKHYL